MKKKFNDWRRRSVVRLISWRIIGGSVTAGIVYAVTLAGWSAAETASLIFICQFTVNALLYYMHDRIWNMSQWGREVIMEDGTIIPRAEYIKTS